MKDYVLLRQLQLERKREEASDRKREETKETAKARPAVMLKTAAANGSVFSSSSAVGSAIPGEQKIQSPTLDFALPQVSGFATTPPPLLTEALQAA